MIFFGDVAVFDDLDLSKVGVAVDFLDEVNEKDQRHLRVQNASATISTRSRHAP